MSAEACVFFMSAEMGGVQKSGMFAHALALAKTTTLLFVTGVPWKSADRKTGSHNKYIENHFAHQRPV